MTYSFQVHNDGEVPLMQLTVTAVDPDTLWGIECGNNALPAPELAVGATLSCTAQYQVSQDDLESGSFTYSIHVSAGSGLVWDVPLATISTVVTPSMSVAVHTSNCSAADAGAWGLASWGLLVHSSFNHQMPVRYANLWTAVVPGPAAVGAWRPQHEVSSTLTYMLPLPVVFCVCAYCCSWRLELPRRSDSDQHRHLSPDQHQHHKRYRLQQPP